jgi:hypothetical protein
MKTEELLKNYASLDIKRLPDIVKKNGYTYKLVKRTNERLLYAQYADNGKIYSYELFFNLIKPYRDSMVAMAKRRNLDCDYSTLPEWYEVFPSDEEFGDRAWCFPNLTIAEKAFNSEAAHASIP